MLPLWLSWSRIYLQCRRPGFNPWVGKIPWRRERLPTPVFGPREFHGLYSPWGRKESDKTQRLSLSLKLVSLPSDQFATFTGFLDCHVSNLYRNSWASQVVSVVKNLKANAGHIRDMDLIPASGRSLGEEMATHSSILAWEIPWTEKPGRLQPRESIKMC